ncbi:MAG: DUF4145 domain-containing protein [Clostridiales bacterium]|nr:DUF4145 domain-containing protein [Clostridiales bacterium]
MTNFDFLLSDPQFTAFAQAAIVAEQVLSIDAASCALNCRRAMEFAVKWMYSVDESLNMSGEDSLMCLLGAQDFQDIVGEDNWQRLDYIRRTGNNAAHSDEIITREQAILCLENLFIFMDFIAYCYGGHSEKRTFNPALLSQSAQPVIAPAPDVPSVGTMLKDNAALRSSLTARRSAQQNAYVSMPLKNAGFETRKLYIDAMLSDAGWKRSRSRIDNFKLNGPDGKPIYIDYVLMGRDKRPVALVEARSTCESFSNGRQQAAMYADLIEKRFDRRPVIFLTNGFETRLVNEPYEHERRISSIYSRQDLARMVNMFPRRSSMAKIKVNQALADRPYQRGAVLSVCRAFSRENRRRALVTMAPGAGKTRTAIALTDVLTRYKWAKRVLFLSDRETLVTQAERMFSALLPKAHIANPASVKGDLSAEYIFSTYKSMSEAIDTVTDASSPRFTCGYFDLILCDEMHHTVCSRYRDLLSHFDARIVGLTSIPDHMIDKRTYDFFALENGKPTFSYALSQAVEDGYLVNYVAINAKLKFMENGIVYDELTEREKLEYREIFSNERGEFPLQISPDMLTRRIFNDDTVCEVLRLVMEQGLRTDNGKTLGKTILFARNHEHAESILEVFRREYPHLPGYASVIDSSIASAQAAIDEFSRPDTLPRIAISADTLDAGIDIPEILNLVFFCEVENEAKFWQMIGRGTRLCPGLIDGKDKQKFHVFDFCGNFARFKRPVSNSEIPLSPAGLSFSLQAQIACRLQHLSFQTEPLRMLREEIVRDMAKTMQKLPRKSFDVRLHIEVVEAFSREDRYASLSKSDERLLTRELALLADRTGSDICALRFDALIYRVMLCVLKGISPPSALAALRHIGNRLSAMGNLDKVREKADSVLQLANLPAVDSSSLPLLESLRKELRTLLHLLDTPSQRTITDFDDSILSVEYTENP